MVEFFSDILERDDVFSLLHQHDILEDEDQMDDETTIQGGDENEEVIIGTSEADSFEAVIERPAQPVSEAVLISEEYSADILAHVKRTEVKKTIRPLIAPSSVPYSFLGPNFLPFFWQQEKAQEQ